MPLFKFAKGKPALNPMKLSPGKLKTYLQCPQKYSYLHVNPRPAEQLSKIHLVFDSALKKCLDRYQSGLDSSKSRMDPDEIDRFMQTQWNPAQFRDDPALPDLNAAAEIAGMKIHEWFEVHSGKSVSFRGKPAVGIFASVPIFPVMIWTRLDRVEQVSDGDLRIVSFKSGARQQDPYQIKTDLSVRLMFAAGKELFGNSLTKIAIVYLRSGKTIELTGMDLQLESLADEVHAIARDIQADRFPPNPGPLCSVCEFQDSCSGWPVPPWNRSNEDRKTYSTRLRLSYSKMSLFERCPRAYHKLYIEGIPPKPQPFFSFGSCIHAVMEDFYDKGNKQKRTLEYLNSILEDKWRFFRAGYRDEEAENQYRQKAVRMIERYFNQFVLNKSFKPAASIEIYFEMPVGDHTIMTGFIDRIDRVSHSDHVVLDYKTEPTRRSQQAVDEDLQLTLYFWAATEFCGLNISALGLYMMAHDELILTTRSSADIPLLLERIESVTISIKNETEFAPKINKYCRSCDHLSGCPLEKDILAREDIRTMEFTDQDA
jgi:RecB family exonuclease